MTTALNNQPALPGLQTAAADAARSDSHFAKCWSAEQRAFATACVEAWNEAFAKHGTRANHTYANHGKCARLLAWIKSPANSGQPMTAQDVLVAIKAYASDPWIREKCGGRYLAFPDWIADAAEKHVDKQLARIGKRRGHAPPTKAEAAAKAEAAREREILDKALAMLRESGWMQIIDQVKESRTHDGNHASLPEGLRLWRAQLVSQMQLVANIAPRVEALKVDTAAIDQRLKWIADYKQVPDKVRRTIHERALKALAPVKEGRAKVAMALALSVELHRRYGTRGPSRVGSAQLSPSPLKGEGRGEGESPSASEVRS